MPTGSPFPQKNTLNQKSLQLLEFPKVRERIASQASFSAGKELALRLEPFADHAGAVRAQAQTAELLKLVEAGSNIGLGGAHDVRPYADSAQLGGLLTAPQLLDIRDTIESARSLHRSIERSASVTPRLWRQMAKLPDTLQLEREIGRCIGARAEVLDAASPTLARIRSHVKSTHERLLERLNQIMNSPRGRTVMQEPLVTLRNGRYVLPVKADFRGEFRGVVHDLSSSGATVFMEPLETLELGNDWRQAQLEEEREVERVLRELSDLVGDYANDVKQTVEILGWFDLTYAKAKYAKELHARPATITEVSAERPPLLRLNTARHPLLTGEVVPLSLELGGEVTELVITGPNTGGKTVAIKTVGLLVVMALSGVPIPVEEETEIPCYREVFCDIGDEQSIEQSLSTFSGHITNIISILARAKDDSLVLLDELGAGTDPEEGSALARAILSDLLERRVPTIATTHHSDLKAFAHNTEGVRNASVEFDLRTLRPTYRLIVGLPGQSNAISIAKRLGLPPRLVEAASDLMHPEHLQVEALLNELQHEREVSRKERARAAEARRKAEDAQRRWASHESEIEAKRTQILEEARQRVARQEEDVRTQLSRATQAIERALREQRREELMTAAKALQQVQERTGGKRWQTPRARQQQAAVAGLPLRLEPGARVRLRGLEQTAEVLQPPNADGEVSVLIGNFRAMLRPEQLEPLGGDGDGPLRAPSTPAERPARGPGWSFQAAPAVTVEPELHLRGQRVEEALEQLDQYLEDAFRAGMPFVRIVHGKGTGVMRQAVRDVLAHHPLVRSYETAAREMGGEGVTVATMAH